MYAEFLSLRSYLGVDVLRKTLTERSIVAQNASKNMSKELTSDKIKLTLSVRLWLLETGFFRLCDKALV